MKLNSNIPNGSECKTCNTNLNLISMAVIFKYFLLLLAFPILSLAANVQDFTVRSLVLDKESGQVLPFANIMVEHRDMGTTADIAGSFSLTLTKELKNDTLVISYMGYHTKRICVCDVVPEGIEMQSKVYLLDAFQVVPGRRKTLEINRFNRRECLVPYSNQQSTSSDLWLPQRPMEPSIEAMFFPNNLEGNRSTLIKEVWIYTRSWSLPAHFRLRILRADESNYPVEDMITENVVVTVNKRQELVKINLEEYMLIFPEKGVFVGVELLIIPENKHLVPLPDNSDVVTLYSPFLQFCTVPHQATYWLYSGGIWEENELKLPALGGDEYQRPAISLIVEL